MKIELLPLTELPLYSFAPFVFFLLSILLYIKRMMTFVVRVSELRNEFNL